MLGKTILTAWLVALPATAMAANVRVDFDHHKDFSNYKTFTVQVGPLLRPDGSVDEVNTLAKNRIADSVTRELVARGLEPVDSGGNLTVRVSGRDINRVAVVDGGWPASPWYWQRRWGYWSRPFGYGYWGAPFYGNVWTREYLENAMTVDVIDRQTDALVYRAQIRDEVGKDPDKQVASSMDKAFKKFPIKEVKEK